MTSTDILIGVILLIIVVICLILWFAFVIQVNREESVEEAMDIIIPKIREEIRAEFKEEIGRKRTYRNITIKQEKVIKKQNSLIEKMKQQGRKLRYRK